MSMYFNFFRDTQLPRLAWVAIVQKNRPAVSVVHGEWVETGKDFFFEGTWNSAFIAGDFDRSSVLKGSGGKLKQHGLTFCPPSHTLARLHIIRRDDTLFVSNSFPFCLSASGNRLKPDYSLYFRDFQSIIRGIEKYKKNIPLEQGSVALRYMDNVQVKNDLSWNTVNKPLPPAFLNYAEYYNYLVETLEKIRDNVTSPARRIQYNFLVTISSGYDSTAGAALSRRIGCAHAITFPEARVRPLSDSGREAAQHLGYSVVEAERLEYQKLKTCPEAEFFAPGTATNGGDIVFACKEELLRRKVFVTGFNGGYVWELKNRPNRAILRTDASGSLMEEFRLRVGFIHLPVPFIGAVRQPEILAISRSPEMKPWVLGGHYEKPIPRRIAEESGIPRSLFGQSKKAIGVRMFDHFIQGPEDMRIFMCPDSFKDYQGYFMRKYKKSQYEKYDKAVGVFSRIIQLFSFIYVKTFPHSGQPNFLSGLRHYLHRIGQNWVLFHWSIDKIIGRYQTRITSNLTEKYSPHLPPEL